MNHAHESGCIGIRSRCDVYAAWVPDDRANFEPERVGESIFPDVSESFSAVLPFGIGDVRQSQQRIADSPEIAVINDRIATGWWARRETIEGYVVCT